MVRPCFNCEVECGMLLHSGKIPPGVSEQLPVTLGYHLPVGCKPTPFLTCSFSVPLPAVHFTFLGTSSLLAAVYRESEVPFELDDTNQHRSHFGSRYTLGCCACAGLFA